MSDYGNVSRKLEAAFFLEEDRKLIEKLKLQKQHEERKAKLTRLFGIHDEDLLHKLLELNIHDETLAALMLIPLLEVAWADGDIQPKEQEAILAMAEKSGLQKGSAELAMLRQQARDLGASTSFTAMDAAFHGAPEAAVG